MQREVLIPHEVIARRVRELAGELDRHYAGEEVVVVGVLMGSFVFMADLVRNLSFPCLIDFVRLASYGSGTESTGQVMMRKDLETEITGRHVLVVEDIVDTGITLDFLVQTLRRRAPESLSVCVLLDKPARRKVPFEADYVGFAIDDWFVVGYGLDYDGRYRALPDVCILQFP